MKFVHWNTIDPLKVNKYGFLEPLNDTKTVYPEGDICSTFSL